MSEDRFGALIGPYVLGELSAEEERELEAHLQRCPRCREELEHVRQAHELLRQAAATETPPPDLKGWVMAHASGEAGDETPAETPDEAATSRGRRLRVLAGVAALLVAGVLGVGIFRMVAGDPSEGLALSATDAAPTAGGELSGEQAGENLRIELEVSGLPELQEGEYYEMWYAKEGEGRISCGTFGVDAEGDATVSMSAPTSSVAYPEIEITREPDDGDPGSSGDKVLVGDLRDL